MKLKVKYLYMCGDAPCGPCKQRAQMKTDFSRRVHEYNKHRQLLQQITIAGEFGSKPISTTPVTGDPTGEVAAFVKPEDKLGAWFAVKIYSYRPSQVMDYTYSEELSSSRIGVWLGCRSAYVIFRGTQPAASGGVNDIIDDFILASENTCELSIANQGREVINEIYFRGYMDIRLAGHSLGGRAALCLGVQPGVTKVVALNAGAPVTAPTSAGPGPLRATHYHIVGDIVSTHLEDSAAENIRILIGDPPKKVPFGAMLNVYGAAGNAGKLGEQGLIKTSYDINWLDTYYHSSDRFLLGDSHRQIFAQEEQDSLELFVFQSQRIVLALTSAATSALGLPFDLILKSSVCENPIPGATQGIICKHESSDLKKVFDKTTNFLAGVLGALAGFVILGPGGVVMGYRAGEELSKGDVSGLLGAVIPGYNSIAEANKAFIEKIVEDIRKRRGDTLEDIIKDRFGKFSARLDPNDPVIQSFYEEQLAMGL